MFDEADFAMVSHPREKRGLSVKEKVETAI
jgi:hypothetical protein